MVIITGIWQFTLWILPPASTFAKATANESLEVAEGGECLREYKFLSFLSPFSENSAVKPTLDQIFILGGGALLVAFNGNEQYALNSSLKLSQPIIITQAVY